MSFLPSPLFWILALRKWLSIIMEHPMVNMQCLVQEMASLLPEAEDVATPLPKSDTLWQAFDAKVADRVNARQELDLYQAKGKLPADVLVIAIDDPKPGVGNGSATFNALLVVTEHLSARAGYTVVESQVLKNARILIFHMGRYFPFSSVGCAFTALPCLRFDPSYSTVLEDFACNLDSLIVTLSHILAVDSPPGVWICSTDMMLVVPPEIVIDWSNTKGVCIFSIPSDPVYAKDHGIFQIGQDNEVDNIFYLASDEELKKCKLSDGQVLIAPALVYVSDEIAQKFLKILTLPEMESCTYLGLDQGAQPNCQLSFVWDILLLMAKNVNKQDFLSGDRSMSFGRKNLADGSIAGTSTLRSVTKKDVSQESRRKILWRELNGTPLKTIVLNGACFDYMSASGKNHRRQMLNCPLSRVDLNNNLPFVYSRHVHSYIETKCKVDDSCVVINSLVEQQVELKKDCVVSHCHLAGLISIGSGCILTGISPEEIEDASFLCEIPDDTILQGFQISQNFPNGPTKRIMVVFGVNDDLKVPVSDSRSTYCNEPWNNFFARTGIRANELWGPDVSEREQSFFNAKLFPVVCPSMAIRLRDMLWLRGAYTSDDAVKNWRSSWRFSLREILDMIDISGEFEWQRRLYFEVGKRRMTETLSGSKNNCLLPFFKNCVIENYAIELLKELDKVACSISSPESSPDCVARTLSCIADVLVEMAGDKVGLRSGPAANENWTRAYRLLENKNIIQGVTELAIQRNKWLGRPDLLIRAARHYEGAMQILVRHAVMTAREFVQFINLQLSTSQIPVGQWFIAEAPARVDLSGAWSDTPPVTYEHGGAVTNIAIKIRGKKPIGAKVRKIPELQLLFVIGSGQGAIRLPCNELSDLQNCSKPNAPGALLMAAFCCANIIDISSPKTLKQQLEEKYGAGFEVQSWSNLPRGSGLGTSSILAGAIMAALLSAAGYSYDNDSLIHAVLLVEQMLTTGGGWQDQVGGLLPGIKIGRSNGQLPLRVESEILDIGEANMEKLIDHSLLVFTGKSRLAKNVLQGVVRNWYTRKPEVIETVDWIERNAENCAVACVEGDVEEIGKCLNNSREQKTIIAPGCEPPQVRELIDVLRPHIHGFLLTGAGGGGFLFAITKEPKFYDKVEELISGLEGERSEEVYIFELDKEGLTLRTE